MTIFMEIAKEILISEITQIVAHYEQVVVSKVTLQDQELAESKRKIAKDLLTNIESMQAANDDKENIQQLIAKLQAAEKASTDAAARKTLGPGHFKVNMDNLTTLLQDVYRELAQSPLEMSAVRAIKVMDRVFDRGVLGTTDKTDENRFLVYTYHLARYYANLCKEIHDANTGGLLWSTTISLKNNPKLTSVLEFQAKTKDLIATNIIKFKTIELQEQRG